MDESADLLDKLLADLQIQRVQGQKKSARQFCDEIKAPQLADDLEALDKAIHDIDRLHSPAPIKPMEPPETVPGFKIGSKIGSGTYGSVYEALQEDLMRTVALKLVHVPKHGNDHTASRFRVEGEAVANLNHPNIVTVHTRGHTKDFCYLSMEYCSQGSLKSRLVPKQPIGPEVAAVWVQKLACAMAHAHTKDIIHRDLKPDNILFSENGEPKIADFGLAKVAGGIDLTSSGTILGTCPYMSPEQAEGRTHAIGPQSDIWSLGVILYECLTGLRPFNGSTQFEIHDQIRNSDPVPPRELVPGLSRDLELICLTCLKREYVERYPSADALAVDLTSYLNGEPPVGVRPPTLYSVLRTWTRQNFGSARWAVVGGIAIGMALGSFSLLQSPAARFVSKGKSAYDRLPSVPRPYLARNPVPQGIADVIEAVMYLLLPILVLLTAIGVRARTSSADRAAGLIAGIAAAITFFTMAFGWWSVYTFSVVPTLKDLNLLAKSDESIIFAYKDFIDMPLQYRRDTLLDKVQFDQALRIPFSIIAGIVMSAGLTIPPCIILISYAGTLLRRHREFHSAFLPYFEVTLPSLVFCGYLFMILQRALMYSEPPQHPVAYCGLLLLTASAVAVHMLSHSRVIRLAFQIGWIIFYLIYNFHQMYEFEAIGVVAWG